MIYYAKKVWSSFSSLELFDAIKIAGGPLPLSFIHTNAARNLAHNFSALAEAFPFYPTASPTSASVSDSIFLFRSRGNNKTACAISLNIRFAQKCRRSETAKKKEEG